MTSSLETLARQIVEKLFGLSDVSMDFLPPQDAAHGDLTTTVALRIAKSVKKKPQDIAAAIAEELQNSPSVERTEVAGAGYVNIWLTSQVLLQELQTTKKVIQPAKIRKKEAPVVIDYSAPNIAKPLGIHHILSTVVGQTISNLYVHGGYNVIRWNYLGDWGTQFGKLAVAYEKWGAKKQVSAYTIDELLALYVRFHDEAEKDAVLEEMGREAFRKLENGDPVLRAFWSDVVAVTKKSLVEMYRRLHVSFDLDLGESFFEDKMGSIVQEGLQKHIFTKGEGGSLIVEFSPEENLPPFLIQKSDGATLYSTRDLAMIRYRIDTYHPQAVYYVVDMAQSMHFRQLFATCHKLQWDLPTLEHTLFGRMRFADSAMSTRKGKVLKLEDVLEEGVRRARAVIQERGTAIQTDDPEALAEMMGVGALVYGIVSQNRKMDIVFDWDKMLSFEGNSAPYLQYTHARARSVLRKGGVGDAAPLPKDTSSLEPHDRRLLNMLLRFSSVLQEARSERLPHKLANYLYALSQDFNAFYNSAPILQAEESVKQLRLALTLLTADVLKCGASLLTIQVPDRM